MLCLFVQPKKEIAHSKTKNHQTIKLNGSLTAKELKKKHSSRLVGGREIGSQGRKASWQGSGWRTRQARQQLAERAAPRLCADKPGGTAGE